MQGETKNEMPACPYWKEPKLVYGATDFKFWSRPYQCGPKCRMQREPDCAGIVRMLPFPDAIK